MPKLTQSELRAELIRSQLGTESTNFDLCRQARAQTSIDKLSSKQRSIYTYLVGQLTDEKKADVSKNISVSQIKSFIEKDLIKNAHNRGYGRTSDFVSDADILRVLRYTFGLVFGYSLPFAFILSVPKNAKSFQSASVRAVESETIKKIVSEKIVLEEVKTSDTDKKAAQSA